MIVLVLLTVLTSLQNFREEAATYTSRKHFTSKNVLDVVDFDINFTYVLASREGSAHDLTIIGDNMSRTDRINIHTCKF
jgi:hypothetical protein